MFKVDMVVVTCVCVCVCVCVRACVRVCVYTHACLSCREHCCRQKSLTRTCKVVRRKWPTSSVLSVMEEYYVLL